MSDPIPSRAEAISKLSAPGQNFELVEQIIDGKPCRVFVNAPKTIRELFEHSQKFAGFDYLVYEDQRFTYADTYAEVAKLALALREDFGIKKGDRVAIGMRNYPEWIIAFMAITSIGGIAVCLNAMWNAEEMVYGVELTGAKLIIADRERVERLEASLETLDLTILSVRCEAHSSTRITPLAQALAGKTGDAIPAADIDPDDDALIIFTSGSTGHPKGAVSSHRAAVHAVISWDFDVETSVWRQGIERPNEPTEVQFSLLVAAPLFHVGASHVTMLQGLNRGRRLVLMYKWDVMQALDIIENEQITHFVAVPTMTGDLVKAAREHGRSLATLLSVGGGGAPRSAKQVSDIDKVFENAAPGTGWGMTETNAIGTGIGGPDYLTRPLSSGQCSAVFDMRILNDDDEDMPTGEPGHLIIRGTGMFREYWNRPDANAEAFIDGWFRTGDIARIDDEGFLFIVDRAKDIVIRGGENIGCGEVEDAIYTHPDVSEVVVFGLPEERLGEEVATLIVPKAGKDIYEEDLRSHLRDHLAGFQIPSRIFMQRDPLPRIASGKFDKRGIRLKALEKLGLEA